MATLSLPVRIGQMVGVDGSTGRRSRGCRRPSTSLTGSQGDRNIDCSSRAEDRVDPAMCSGRLPSGWELHGLQNILSLRTPGQAVRKDSTSLISHPLRSYPQLSVPRLPGRMNPGDSVMPVPNFGKAVKPGPSVPCAGSKNLRVGRCCEGCSRNN